MIEPAMHAHAAGTIVGKAALRRDRERFDARRSLRPAGHVHLGRADRGGDAAVQVAFEKADGVLARRVVAEGDVHMRVDQAGDGRDAVGIDDDVGGFEPLRTRCRPTTIARRR